MIFVCRRLSALYRRSYRFCRCRVRRRSRWRQPVGCFASHRCRGWRTKEARRMHMIYRLYFWRNIARSIVRHQIAYFVVSLVRRKRLQIRRTDMRIGDSVGDQLVRNPITIACFAHINVLPQRVLSPVIIFCRRRQS